MLFFHSEFDYDENANTFLLTFVFNLYLYNMSEIIFIVEESPEGGYQARALDHSIFTDGETLEELRMNVKESVHCHFESEMPKLIRLHFVKEEVFAA